MKQEGGENSSFKQLGHFQSMKSQQDHGQKKATGGVAGTNFSEWVQRMQFNFCSSKNLTMQVLKLC